MLAGHGAYFSSGERPDRFKNEAVSWRAGSGGWSSAVGGRHAGDGWDPAGHLRQSARSSLVNRSRPGDAGRRLGVFKYSRDGRELAGVPVLAAFLVGLMAATYGGHYLLAAVDGRSILRPHRGEYRPRKATAKSRLLWFAVGITLAVGYFVISFVRFGEKLPGMQTVTATKSYREGVLSPEGGGRHSPGRQPWDQRIVQ